MSSPSKRMASSVFITLASPRREAAPREPCLSAFAFGAGQWGVLLQAVGALLHGEGSGWGWQRSPNTHCLASAAESCPRSPAVPSSPPALVLSEAPQPLSAEALAPALQQLDLAAPATVQHMALAVVVPQWGHQGSSLPCSLPTDICAFCHKAVGPQEPTVEAMRKQYHADCFTCRTCQRRLAGQRYYQRDGRPTCDACYQATLEKCAKCQGLITERIVRALGKGFHPGCFVCAACGRAIGAESFAVDEQGKVYCVADFYRKFAPVCGACKRPIIPDEDTYKIECLGRSFHESCYRCESCGTPLSPEPTEDGCYPLGHHLLCKACHMCRRNESSC
uniref:Filamin binding LIM protein 1 n=1 Tax=Phasianus colchicus TaxID=9054 RepID=A0A669QPH9_PHACC